MTKLGISIEAEQLLLAEVTKLNADYWAGELTDKQQQMILKFGSKEKAIEETFTILWLGVVKAIQRLKN
jgi:hypothetical protein